MRKVFERQRIIEPLGVYDGAREGVPDRRRVRRLTGPRRRYRLPRSIAVAEPALRERGRRQLAKAGRGVPSREERP